MNVLRFDTARATGAAAAEHGAAAINAALVERQAANIVLATGASQFEMLNHLVSLPVIDWSAVTVFHLDEYIGLPNTHPASFRRYLRERFVAGVPALKAFHAVDGDAESPQAECERLNAIIQTQTIDVAFVGIGENGHLAFNDPPADFDTEASFIVVNLDEACRKQQLGEGWFATLDEVPRQAISMSIRQILKSRCLIVTVPDLRKAQAVKAAVEGEISPMCPASILQTHPTCTLFLDTESASLLYKSGGSKFISR
jgi:glucosamine-6-phosphate deaminase